MEPRGGATAQLALWLVPFLAAHALAGCFVLQTLLLARPDLRAALQRLLGKLPGCAGRRPPRRGGGQLGGAAACEERHVAAAPRGAVGGATPGAKGTSAQGQQQQQQQQQCVVLVTEAGEAAEDDAASGAAWHPAGSSPTSSCSGGGGGGGGGTSREGAGEGASPGASHAAPPRAARPGRRAAVALRWEGVGVGVRAASGCKWVLRDAWGEASAGEMQALLGPSGAGKSTLLDVLAGRRRLSAGRVIVAATAGAAAGVAAAPAAGRGGGGSTGGGGAAVGLVPQHDAFPPTLTAGEVVRFYESLLPPAAGGPGGARGRAVGALAAMGLGAAEGTLVGGALPGGIVLPGLSGGERKRLAIAVGLAAAPRVLLLDEPTSGLDSSSARGVLEHVRRSAAAGGRAVLASVHQPAPPLWELFDSATLLADGRQLYCGPAAGLAPWLAAAFCRPYDPAAHGLPPDFALTIASTAFGGGGGGGAGGGGAGGGGAATAAELAAAADTFRALQQQVEGHEGRDEPPPRGADAAAQPAAGLAPPLHQPLQPRSRRARAAASLRASARQLGPLLRRELTLITRNPADAAGRALTFVWVAAAVGLVAYSLPAAASGLRARLGILFSSLSFLLLFPMLATSLVAGDKASFVRDRGAFGVAPYYAAKARGAGGWGFGGWGWLQVAATTPLGAQSAAAFHLVVYGLSGLRHGAAAAAASCAMSVGVFLVAAQALHLAVLVAPHQDSAFMLSIGSGGLGLRGWGWCALQMVFSGFFVEFHSMRFPWLSQLRHLSALHFALDGSATVEFGGRSFPCDDPMPSGAARLLSGLASASPAATGAAAAAAAAAAVGGPGACAVEGRLLLDYFGFGRRGVAGCLGALLAYLSVLHVLSFAALLALSRRRR
ncbi:hypothetical protein Rsub_02038 [Raphidocelis subcapitata]|uniref:ABC transporter domain-containing protein n=1 Tax=Raphidocelis subcapitata TaxID=307507 RepID=A0A2V0NPE4_9CHLO|nr:hypothetical protein Rsub_02038 [Raphidocelis subcapitata]|eukprot:GBF89466.1 hypothetical protein Rsub_02038 [Raphidocelis subcapitata]